ncbi:hypothetical protein ISS07_06015 [Candidatus Woesearchaeota archaeon]|nr:hypothetical protein [Candidatus Woesearchaeota archaeon]
MAESKISSFETVLLVVGLAAGLLGFNLINQAYIIKKEISWLMIIAIFNWLMLLVLFISLSLAVDFSKKQFQGVEKIIKILEEQKGKKKK